MDQRLLFLVIGVLVLFAALVVGHGAWLDAEATARLAELDLARAAWQTRLARFRAQRTALLIDPRLGDVERQRQIAELYARSFTAQERLRVEALERRAAGGGGH